MSVWLSSPISAPVLTGAEGALVSVSVSVDPRDLEDALEALAGLEFPINPEIFHDASLVYVHADGRQDAQAVTLVEFPAYESRLDEIRAVLASHGFPADCVASAAMLDNILHDAVSETVPAGAPYARRLRVKRRLRASA